MDRPSNPENFERAEPSEESSDDQTYAVREGVTRAIDPDEIELRRDRAVADDDTATGDETEEPLDAGFQSTRPAELLGAGDSSGSDDDTGSATVREGVTRAIDPDELELRRQRGLTEDDNAARVHGDIAGFDPDRELARPPDFPESLDVATVAPDGTTVPGRTSQLTDPLTGAAIGGGGVRDSVMSGAGALGGGAPDRGLDFDLTSPGTQDQDSRETTGDPSVDRAISEHDGSQYSAPKELPVYDPDAPPRSTPKKEDAPPAPKEDRLLPDWMHDAYDFVVPPKVEPPKPPKEVYTENPDADTGDSVTNLERVTVMQGSQVQPSNNPDDPATGGVRTEGWIPPADLETMPAQDGEATATTLTSAATLGTSPVTNPSDPVLGDDGIITGGTYGGSGGSGGGGEIMPTGMSAGDASALGGEGEANLPIGGGGEASALGGAGDANLPITVEPAPVGGGASALGGEGEANLPITVEPAPVVGAGELAQKDDINGASIDMATGQVVGSAGPGDDAASAIGAGDATLGGESLGAPGGLEDSPPIGEESPPPDGDDS